MKKRSLILLMAGVVTTGVLSMGAISFAASPHPNVPRAVTAMKLGPMHSVKDKHYNQHHLRHVTAVTSTTVTIARGKHVKTLNFSAITVRAGLYSVPSSFLQVGQHVVQHGNYLQVIPVAQGVLTASCTGWTVVNPHHTVTLAGSAPTLLGLTALTANTKVMIFGTRSGTTVTMEGVAALPTRTAATVVSNQNGILTVKTSSNPSITITESAMSSAKWLAKLHTGRRVIIWLNPATQVPLAVMPAPRHRLRALGQHMVVGKLVSDSAQNLVVSNRLGSDTITLSNQTVHVVWPHHTGATLSHVPVGTLLMVHEQGANTLMVRVF